MIPIGGFGRAEGDSKNKGTTFRTMKTQDLEYKIIVHLELSRGQTSVRNNMMN